MLILGIDTATLTLSAALVERQNGEDRLIERVTEPPPTPHSSLLPSLLEAMLSRAGAKLGDLSGVVIGRGPGSFTGLRISLATAKGICYALKIPLVGASSLASMARAAAADFESGALMIPCLDARKGEVYAGFFRAASASAPGSAEAACLKLEQVEAEAVLSPPALLERIGSRNAQVFGLGRDAYPDFNCLPIAPTDIRTPDAAALIASVAEIPSFSKQALFSLEPHYVRPSDSEWTIRPRKQ